MIRKLGIIGEHSSDTRTVAVLARRILGRELPIVTRDDEGQGKVVAKAASWLRELVRKGCDSAVIIADLDRDGLGTLKDEQELRKKLEAVAVPDGLSRLICIPVEELEAWFWSDPGVLSEIAGRPFRATPHPHTIRDPKGKLIELSRRGGKRPRYSSADNVRYAAALDLDLCASRCGAFRDLKAFLKP